MLKFLRGTWGLNFLGMVPGTQFHHQNTLAKEGHGIGVYDYIIYMGPLYKVDVCKIENVQWKATRMVGKLEGKL